MFFSGFFFTTVRVKHINFEIVNEKAIYLEHQKSGVTPNLHKQQVFKIRTLSSTTINVTG